MDIIAICRKGKKIYSTTTNVSIIRTHTERYERDHHGEDLSNYKVLDRNNWSMDDSQPDCHVYVF